MLIFEEGDGICIPEGCNHKHKAKVLSDVVKILFIDDVLPTEIDKNSSCTN